MKNNRLKFLFSYIMIVFFFCYCNKKDTPAPSKTDLITRSAWKFSSATVSGTDVKPFLQTCQTDNILSFDKTNNGILDEGAAKCNAADAQTRSFTWNFQSGETVLYISSTLFALTDNTFDIVTLNESQLVVTQRIPLSGSFQDAVITFVH